MTETMAFARPDMAEGRLWIETPQTQTAMVNLFRLLDVARRDEPGWQPYWVLCGPAGVGKTELARRFASQAQRSSACDAVREAEQYLRAPPQIPSPGTFAKRDDAWARYREFSAMDASERVRRFGHCPHVCRPAEFLPNEALEAALMRAKESCPAGIGHLTSGSKGMTEALHDGSWSMSRYYADDPIRRTSLFFVDDADHLTRLNANKRGDALAKMREFPKDRRLGHPVTFVLIGTPTLADAIAECGEMRRIDLPAMDADGPDGTFGQVCKLVFGTREPDDVARLHGATKGAIGPLLTLAYLQGRRPPFCVPETDILRLPGPQDD